MLWSKLVDTIGRQLMIVSPGEEVEEFCALKLRLARLRENQLDNKQDAIAAYQEILYASEFRHRAQLVRASNQREARG